MIAKEDLKEYGKILGFNLGQAEKDYLQHIFLLFLSRNITNELVFKGGTALQKVYGLNRFSIDLDFTQAEKCNTVEIMEKISKNITQFGYPSSIKEVKTSGRTFLFKIEGPLYMNTEPSICSLRVEISQRESILLKPEIKTITPLYPDLQPYTATVMQQKEILVEKVRAIMARNKPRDIFDLHFLLEKKVPFDIDLINKKLEYYGKSYNKEKFRKSLKAKRSIWEKELKNYMANVPSFDMLSKEIRKGI